MQVRMNVAIPARGVEAGDVVDVSQHEAETWLQVGNAVAVDEEVELEPEEVDADEDEADEDDEEESEESEEDFFDIN